MLNRDTSNLFLWTEEQMLANNNQICLPRESAKAVPPSKTVMTNVTTKCLLFRTDDTVAKFT